ncbi:MAG: Xaa-Pro peptidase family protein [Treponema sp.]|jgi:Xaa-Pro dipeptidase|nr:Xaa-Pro peptidase family protein [Treponema sp.]
MKAFLEARRQKIYDCMAQNGISLVMFEDVEGRRDPAIRWLTGHPGDAVLFLSADRKNMLVPWDANMAAFYADADAVVPYGEFELQPAIALHAATAFLKIRPGSRIEISPITAYPTFLKFIEEFSDYDLLCRSNSIHDSVEELRQIKDEEELRIYRKAAKITNEIIDLLEENVRSETIKTETDAALFIEAEGRRRGCEGTGFETLAAGPGRSFGIHAFPAYTGDSFAAKGLSILDFGLKYEGYTTDVTMTFARAPLTRAQEKQLALVEKAYKLALSLAGGGVSTWDIALAVEALFGKSRRTMPHGLGHGIGLQIHEKPLLRTRKESARQLAAGMIFTIEPGLYDPVSGGCRLENDVLITAEGAEVLTRSRIVRL